MKKLFSLFVAALFCASMWAAQGGTLTAPNGSIYPTETVTLTYDATDAFSGWTPMLHIHAWLVAVDGQEFSKSYAPAWATCEGDEAYAALDDKVKMTRGDGDSRIYTISMNIKDFFDVADDDLSKIEKLGVIVRAQWDQGSDNNKTGDMFIDVAYDYNMKNSWGTASWTWKEMTWDATNKNFKLDNVVFGGGGVDINKIQSETGKTYVLASDFSGYQPETYDTVKLVLTPSTKTVTATLLGKYRPTIKLFGGMGSDAWADGEDFLLANDRSKATLSVNFATTGYYHFKVKSDGTQLGKNNSGSEYGLHSEWTSVSGLGDGSDGISLNVSKIGSYTFTYTFEGSVLSVSYPDPTAVDNTEVSKKAVKRIVDGQLVIERDGKFYNALGAEMK